MPSSPGANVSQSSLTDIPSMDDLVAHYEKVLSELDAVLSDFAGALTAQKDLALGDEGTTP